MGRVAPLARILMLGIALLALLPSAGQAAPDNVEALRKLALARVNEERQRRDLAPLAAKGELDRAAQAHADDMAARNYYSHVSPEGEDVMARYRRAGGSQWRLVAENIATCAGCGKLREAVERLHRGWMDSPSHRASILNPGLTQFGFGIAVRRSGRSGGDLYAVQTFAGPGMPRATPEDASGGAAETPLAASMQTAAALDLINEVRRQAGAAPLAESDGLSAAARGLLPESGDLTLAQGDLFDALPPAERQAWRSLAVVAGACGGCGGVPVVGDVRFFRDSWLRNPQYRETLLDANVTHLGFAIRADGTGRKVAAAVLGRRQ